MATLQLFDDFVTEVSAGTHANAINAATDTLRLALTNATPNAATWTQLSDVTQISYTNISETWPVDIVNTTNAPGVSGVITVSGSDQTATATGVVPTFRYVILYNDTATNDELIGWWDNGSAVDLTTGQIFTVDLTTQALFTIGA
jgi:hypothetical protein